MLLVATAGCTSDDPGKSAPSPLPSRSVDSAATLEAKPVPMDVTVGKVAGGKLKQQQQIEAQVSKVLSRYFDAAFLAGEYPRKDFSGAFASFSPGAAQRAAADRVLLTNAAIGTTTEAIVPRSKQARLDLLIPKRTVAALTARVRLLFVQERADGADQLVTVEGRLMIDRKKSGAWQIFGYDLTRSSVPVAKGADR